MTNSWNTLFKQSNKIKDTGKHRKTGGTCFPFERSYKTKKQFCPQKVLYVAFCVNKTKKKEKKCLWTYKIITATGKINSYSMY